MSFISEKIKKGWYAGVSHLKGRQPPKSWPKFNNFRIKLNLKNFKFGKPHENFYPLFSKRKKFYDFNKFWLCVKNDANNNCTSFWKTEIRELFFDFCVFALCRKFFSLKYTIKKSNRANFSGKRNQKAFVIVNF